MFHSLSSTKARISRHFPKNSRDEHTSHFHISLYTKTPSPKVSTISKKEKGTGTFNRKRDNVKRAPTRDAPTVWFGEPFGVRAILCRGAAQFAPIYLPTPQQFSFSDCIAIAMILDLCFPFGIFFCQRDRHQTNM
jgi:hypothetical protein